jgi:hypothetical protein
MWELGKGMRHPIQAVLERNLIYSESLASRSGHVGKMMGHQADCLGYLTVKASSFI